MRIPAIKSNLFIPFKSQTVYYDNKIVEEDVTTIEKPKSYFSNPVSPNQNFIGFNLIPNSKNTILIKSRYNHIIGSIRHNNEANLPKINIISGSHQPVIELVDEELGIKILLNRGSILKGKNLDISYDKIAEKQIFIDRNRKITFGNNIYLATGYKSNKTESIIKNYYANRKNFDVETSPYVNKIKKDYSIVGLAAGYGTRLKPVSDLTNDNKPTTKFPSTGKTLLETSCLDTAARAGHIKYYYILNEDENNLSGTAGPIIKGIKSGKIPLDKPLVILTSDTFNNIDLAKVLYDFERSKNTGIGVVVKNIRNENLYNVPLVEINPDDSINKFHEKINSENYLDIISQNKNFYTSTNIMVLHPKILELLEKFGDKNSSADFLEFLNLMMNTLNKNFENLERKYPEGLGNKDLKINDLTDILGYPKNILDKDYNSLKVKAIYANDIKGETPHFADIGTVEKFIETVKNIKKNKKINGISDDFIKKIKENIDRNGLIFMQPEAANKLEKFKQKYDINNLEGNVIVSTISSKKNYSDLTKNYENISEINKKKSEDFVKKIMDNPEKLKQVSRDLIKQYGLENFLKWYLSDDGYYGAYEKYVDDLYKNAESIDELLKFMPNWSPWKLEEKFWQLNNSAYTYISKGYAEMLYKNEVDSKREQPFTIGTLPLSYFTPEILEKIVHRIRTENINNDELYVDNCYFKVTRLKGGELNDKLIYKINRFGKDFILKMDRSYAEDNDAVWMYDKKVIKKNKVLAADSNYTNACISRYLELNGCKNIPKLLFYDYKNDAALYEYVEDVKGDLFQQGKMDTEYSDLNLSNCVIDNLREKGIYLNDTALKNFFVEKDGTEKIIDLGHANFIMPFKPGVKYYNVEFSNINGPDFRTIYASLL